ncbi:MAG: hypothetical protein JOZ07_16725 [Solirubrobacterales bacterium]|nr:hypothetical protein [Solirubrobacterales bacterium]
MLLRNRAPDVDPTPVTLARGLEHLDQGWIALLRWCNALRLHYVVVGPVAHAIRGDAAARGPVAIVPAPYGRNWERLANALVAQHAGLRSDRALSAGGEAGSTVPVKLTADKLARGRRWMLRFGAYDLDIESAGRRPAAGEPPTGTPRYQELLYESGRFQLAEAVAVEVASPEDLEHFSHVRRTGAAPEFRVIRTAAADGAATAEHSPDSSPDP